jgi:hypothetical protein
VIVISSLSFILGPPIRVKLAPGLHEHSPSCLAWADAQSDWLSAHRLAAHGTLGARQWDEVPRVQGQQRQGYDFQGGKGGGEGHGDGGLPGPIPVVTCPNNAASEIQDGVSVSAGAGWWGRRQREVLSDGDFDDAGTVHRQCLHDGVGDLVRA